MDNLFGKNAFGVDREAIGKEGIIRNSMATVGDRDFILESMHRSSLLMPHVSRMAENLIFHETSKAGSMRLADSYTRRCARFNNRGSG